MKELLKQPYKYILLERISPIWTEPEMNLYTECEYGGILGCRQERVFVFLNATRK